MKRPEKRFTIGGLLLGVGLGGFVDGIVLHQILQWHHMLSSTGEYPVTTIAGLEANTLADGLFHAFTWAATVVGLYMVYPSAREKWDGTSLARLTALLLIGWGGFNIVEGVVDHQILGVHHVHPSEAIGWDLAFLALGGLLIAAGLAMETAAGRRTSRRRDRTTPPLPTPALRGRRNGP